jgi:ABC-2 type transport system ATP-binding protein
MKRRANLATSIIHDPPIVILDEPTVGFDPTIKTMVFSSCEKLLASKRYVIF